MATIELLVNSIRHARMTGMALALTACILTNGSTLAEVHSERFPVTPDRIIAAIRDYQLPTAGVEVKLSIPMTTQAPDSQLDVQEISKTGATSARLRITCHQRGQCLPFFVSATWPAGVSFVQTTAQAAPSHTGQPRDAVRRAGMTKGVESTSPQTRTDGGPVVFNGSPATLLFEDHKMQIRLQVVCLQDGADGAHIRVATLDRKHSYTAEVVMPGLVKGSF